MTTLPGDWAEDEPQSQLVPPEEAWNQIAGIPVRIVSAPQERESPEFGAWSTVFIGQAGQVSASPYCSQVLQRRYRRFKAKFGPITFGTGATAVIFNNRPDPLTGPNPQGWTVTNLTGSNPVPSQPAVPASTVAQQNANNYPVNVTLTGFTATAVTVNGVQVGTGNGTYLVPAGGTIAVTYTVAGTWVWANASSAPATVPGTALPDYDAEQPLYAIAVGGTATLPVLDESFGYLKSD